MRDPIFAGEYTTVYYHLPEAACRGKSTDLFFSQDAKEMRQAKRICRSCPERERCLEMAIANAESGGVWGGVVFRRGKPDVNDMEYWRSKEQAVSTPAALPSDVTEGVTAEEETKSAPGKATTSKKSDVTKKKKKNGRSPEEGFSRYPIPTRTVLPPSK
jgi:hypothetical protein